jgi:hypothetical protein
MDQNPAWISLDSISLQYFPQDLLGFPMDLRMPASYTSFLQQLWPILETAVQLKQISKSMEPSKFKYQDSLLPSLLPILDTSAGILTAYQYSAQLQMTRVRFPSNQWKV